MLNSKKLFPFILISVAFFSQAVSLYAKNVRIATYNVENLFDLEASGYEYAEYIPNNIFGWNKKSFQKKLENISQVIIDINPDIIGLQEIESEKALLALQNTLSEKGLKYKYHAISKKAKSAVSCALLSKYPITDIQEIAVKHEQSRDILKTTVNIDDNPLIIYVNHWKSKNGPESLRIKSAKALADDLKPLAQGTDFVIIGDFNSDYDEYKKIKNSPRLNDSHSKTGINHILGTIRDSDFVTEKQIVAETNKGLLYNLWLEIPETKRWSYIYKKQRSSPDSIIISPGLYDQKGIAYLDDSFDRFAPNYLFKHNRIFRWQRSDNGHGYHLNSGYSDHLPLYALLTTQPFSRKNNNYVLNTKENQRKILDINQATVAELIQIRGIGKKLAIRIVTGRPYKKIEDLLKIQGIGTKRLNTIKKYFTVSP
jgi:endonuclease/exonuclease/phosphatase family metal-dependent hydrolase